MNSDMEKREMMAEEWAAKLVGSGEDALAIALKAAEARGHRAGRRSLAGAVEHFETAYRYAVNARERIGKTGPDGEPEADYVNDAFESANIMASIAYKEWFGPDWPNSINTNPPPPSDSLTKEERG